MSTPAKINLIPKRTYTVALSGVVGAGPNVGLTLVSSAITFRFRVVGAEIVFRNDTANLLRIYPLLSRDTTTSNINPPADTNLLAPFGSTTYLIGEGLIKRVKMDYVADPDQTYIKIHGLNGCAYAQTINATVEIEEV